MEWFNGVDSGEQFRECIRKCFNGVVYLSGLGSGLHRVVITPYG